ncbi:MtrB/PioB family outer membrane beta-barrel protein [Methyloprofundus sedimenti]|uniref:MtrB/PioB family outer membrane beta-barrel protein n=1 Tax=Methyloprofundus sedimenti TaxID=1420851 RepID=UPI00118055C1
MCGKYALTAKLSIRVLYFGNYALDNISPDSIDEVHSLGNSSLDYNAHVIGLSAIYQF